MQTDIITDGLPAGLSERDRALFAAAAKAGLYYVFGFDNSHGLHSCNMHVMGACFGRHYIPEPFKKTNDVSLHVYHYDIATKRWNRDLIEFTR